MRRPVTIAALAFSSLAGICAKGRERPGAPTGHPTVGQAVRDTSPWVRVVGSLQRQELDTTTIIRSDSNRYEGWVRRPIESEQGARESYRVRYEVDCLAGLVRVTQAAVYNENGARTKILSPAEIAHSGEGRWSDERFRDLAVVRMAICDRVRVTDLPIVKP
jgi:hypothetical protein